MILKHKMDHLTEQDVGTTSEYVFVCSSMTGPVSGTLTLSASGRSRILIVATPRGLPAGPIREKSNGAERLCVAAGLSTRKRWGATAGVHFERVRVVVNGEIASGAGLMSFDPTELLVEIADATQEIIMNDCMVWPECHQHHVGLHPELVDGEAVWLCRVGGHTIAHIGRLGETVPQSAKAAKLLERRNKRH